MMFFYGRLKLCVHLEYIILYDDDNRTNTYLAPLSGKEIKYVYNRLYLMTKTIYQDGSYEESKYDKAGRCYTLISQRGIKQFAYDPMDIVRRVTDENLNKTEYTYDTMFNLTYIIPPNVSEDSKAPLLGEHLIYDYFNNHISSRDGLGNIFDTPRDLEGNVAKEINPNTYDADTKDGYGIVYTYDAYDRVIKVAYPDGGIQRLKYDCNGNLIKVIQPEEYNESLDDGRGFCYKYDTSNRLIEIIDPDGVVVKSYIYECAKISLAV